MNDFGRLEMQRTAASEQIYLEDLGLFISDLIKEYLSFSKEASLWSVRDLIRQSSKTCKFEVKTVMPILSWRYHHHFCVVSRYFYIFKQKISTNECEVLLMEAH